MTTEFKLKLTFLVAFIFMAANGAVPFVSSSWTHSHQESLRNSQQKIEFITNLFSMLKDAESGQRGFAITGNEDFLEPYHAAVVRLTGMLPKVDEVIGKTQEEQQHAEEIQQFSRLKLDDMAATIALRREQGFDKVQAVISTAKGKSYMDQVRVSTDALIRLEIDLREKLQQDLNRRVSSSVYFSITSTLLNMLLLGVALFYLFRSLRERQQIARNYQLSSEKLNAGVEELERRNREILLIGQMARALESQIDLKEAFDIIGVFYSKLLPETSGVVYLFRNSGDLLEKEAHWGTPRLDDACILPDACWALRRGQPHLPLHNQNLPCPHYGSGHDAQRICLPLMAQGEVLGLIYIEASGTGRFDPRLEDLAISISEQVALALSNARLRKVLKEQSILDPLTGMFNRRYMEETLRCEIARAQRMSSALSLIVMDVDHFKSINDSIGHEGGDIVLKALAKEIQGSIRESDVPCRYGGEEFVLILSDCDKPAAIEKAERIGECLRSLELKHGGHPIGRVTASMGVASFPEDGAHAEDLVQAADLAMYFGKKNGRNRVVPAGPKAVAIDKEILLPVAPD